MQSQESINASLESIRTLPRTGTPGKWSNVASNDIHSDWLIFTLSCTGQKINKNKEFTADVVFHLLAMHWVQMSNFWRFPEPKNLAKACQYIHGGRVFFTALGQSKKLKNEDSTVHAVFYLIVMHRVWMSNFWRSPEPKNPVKACQYIHSDRVFFTMLWASQKDQKMSILQPMQYSIW